jgi:hypothetical protein
LQLLLAIFRVFDQFASVLPMSLLRLYFLIVAALLVDARKHSPQTYGACLKQKWLAQATCAGLLGKVWGLRRSQATKW